MNNETRDSIEKLEEMYQTGKIDFLALTNGVYHAGYDEGKADPMPVPDVSVSTVIKELHKALTMLLQATDDEGWINDETGEDWEEQSQARKALANVPAKYLL